MTLRVPIPISSIDEPAVLLKRWAIWSTMPVDTQERFRERERSLHDAILRTRDDRMRHVWLYGEDG